jgi:predicted ester cyclase
VGVAENIDVVRRLEDVYNRRDYSALPELIADGIEAHTPGADQLPQNHQGFAQNNEGSYGAFPDRMTEILDIFGEGGKVVAHIRMTGTNKGGLPWFGIPANDAAVDFDWIQISRHDEGGKIVETWSQIEAPKLMQQLGAMPGM